MKKLILLITCISLGSLLAKTEFDDVVGSQEFRFEGEHDDLTTIQFDIKKTSDQKLRHRLSVLSRKGKLDEKLQEEKEAIENELKRRRENKIRI